MSLWYTVNFYLSGLAENVNIQLSRVGRESHPIIEVLRRAVCAIEYTSTHIYTYSGGKMSKTYYAISTTYYAISTTNYAISKTHWFR